LCLRRENYRNGLKILPAWPTLFLETDIPGTEVMGWGRWRFGRFWSAQVGLHCRAIGVAVPDGIVCFGLARMRIPETDNL